MPSSAGEFRSLHLSPACQSLVRWYGDGVALARLEDEPGLYLGMKDLYAFLVFERGASQFVHRGVTHAVGPGDIVVVQPGEVYRDVQRAGTVTFDIVFFDTALTEAARAAAGHRAVVSGEPVLSSGDPRIAPLSALQATLSRSSAALERETGIQEAARALVEVTAVGAVPGRRERPTIQRARQYLRERVAEQVHLDELADHVRMDKHHLIRAFRAHVGVPPYEYLTYLRVTRAMQMLRGGASPARAAAALGYYDQSQLHRHFVRLVGTTPGAFAAAARSRFIASFRSA